MTAIKAVADDMLGKIATKQWELMRRVKDGSLDPEHVLRSLQAFIENETAGFKFEKIADWTVSAKVHEVIVDEGKDFMSTLSSHGGMWNYYDGGGKKTENQFILEGSGKAGKKKTRFRLAEINTEEASVGLIRLYAEDDRFELANPWDLLSFVEQASFMRIIRKDLEIIAIGGPHGQSLKSDGATKRYHNLVVRGVPDIRTWNFQWRHMEDSIVQLSNKSNVMRSERILLKEKR